MTHFDVSIERDGKIIELDVGAYYEPPQSGSLQMGAGGDEPYDGYWVAEIIQDSQKNDFDVSDEEYIKIMDHINNE